MMSPFGFSPYGGFGYSPFGFGGGFGGGFGPSGTDQRIQEQQHQDERSIDQQKSQIDALQKEIETLKAQKK
jgi:TolA-binding protein